MSALRVLFLNPSGQLGGAEWSMLNLLSGLRKLGSPVDARLVVSEDGPLRRRAEESGVHTRVLPFPHLLAQTGDSSLEAGFSSQVWRSARAGTACVGYCRELRRVIREIAPDVVHTNGFKMHLLGSWAARPTMQTPFAPVIAHIHDYVSPRRVARHLVKARAGSFAHFVTNSRSVEADLRSYLGRTNVSTIWNAVDLDRYRPEGESYDLDVLSGLPAPGRPLVRIGLVGTFARWKGHLTFLQALSRLSSDIPFRGYVVGGPIYKTDGSQWTRTELQAKSEQLGLHGRIGFTGFLENTAAAMRSLDIVVHASTAPEPFGMVIAEALASRRAVIASGAGGAKELIEHAVTGWRHIPGDVESLAAGLKALISDPDLRARLAAAGHAQALDRFSPGLMASRFLSVYERVAQRKVEGRLALEHV